MLKVHSFICTVNTQRCQRGSLWYPLPVLQWLWSYPLQLENLVFLHVFRWSEQTFFFKHFRFFVSVNAFFSFFFCSWGISSVLIRLRSAWCRCVWGRCSRCSSETQAQYQRPSTAGSAGVCRCPLSHPKGKGRSVSSGCLCDFMSHDAYLLFLMHLLWRFLLRTLVMTHKRLCWSCRRRTKSLVSSSELISAQVRAAAAISPFVLGLK